MQKSDFKQITPDMIKLVDKYISMGCECVGRCRTAKNNLEVYGINTECPFSGNNSTIYTNCNMHNYVNGRTTIKGYKTVKLSSDKLHEFMQLFDVTTEDISED